MAHFSRSFVRVLLFPPDRLTTNRATVLSLVARLSGLEDIISPLLSLSSHSISTVRQMINRAAASSLVSLISRSYVYLLSPFYYFHRLSLALLLPQAYQTIALILCAFSIFGIAASTLILYPLPSELTVRLYQLDTLHQLKGPLGY